MKKTFKITTPEGLHARPSALLVTAVTPFECDVLLTYNDKSVNLKSIMGVMALGILREALWLFQPRGQMLTSLYRQYQIL